MGASGNNTQYFRESTRAPLRAPVTLQIDTFKDPEPGFTGNISIGGMFVQVDDPMPVGSIIRFELHLEPPSGVVRGTAEVVWIRPYSSNENQAGIGLQFRHLEDNGETIVRSAVEKILEAQGLTVEPPAVERSKPKPRRPRKPAPAGKVPTPDSERSKSDKKQRKKEADKGSKKKGSDSDERRKLIAAIILIAALILLLIRTLG